MSSLTCYRLSRYRKKLQNLFHFNYGLQSHQIWIQLIPVSGEYCKRSCTKHASLICTNWNIDWEWGGPSRRAVITSSLWQPFLSGLPIGMCQGWCWTFWALSLTVVIVLLVVFVVTDGAETAAIDGLVSSWSEKNFCFILSTSTKIRIDSVMRPRSSSTVTVTVADVDNTNSYVPFVGLFLQVVCSGIVM